MNRSGLFLWELLFEALSVCSVDVAGVIWKVSESSLRKKVCFHFKRWILFLGRPHVAERMGHRVKCKASEFK